MFVVVTNPTPGGPGATPKGGPGGFFAAAGKWLTRFGRAGGAGAGLAASGFYMDRGIVDDKGNPAKIADKKQTEEYLKSIEQIGVNLDAARAKAAGFGDELDLIGGKKVAPQIKGDSIKAANDALAKFIGYQIDAGRPVTPYINTTSIERAIALARTLDAELRRNAVPTAGVDNGAGYMHGGTPDANPRAGVLIDQRGSTIVAHDYDDFVSQSQKKAQRAGLGGRPNP
jgi:hypothetical protein